MNITDQNISIKNSNFQKGDSQLNSDGKIERFVPPPPAIKADEIESSDEWGFEDSGFTINERGHATFTGKRYDLSGLEMPVLVPWICEMMDVKVSRDEINQSNYPNQIPDAITHPSFLQVVQKILKADQISTEGKVRLRHGHGQTQEEMYNIKYGKMKRIPDLVVFPTEEEQVNELVKAAIAHQVVLIPYGGGTSVTEALCCPENETRFIVSVDMKHMNRILWIDKTNRMACIQAGAVGRHIAKQLEEYGFTMGHEPDSIEFSTLGGWIATNASGMKKNKYGNIEDIVLDVNVVTVKGDLRRSSIAPRESIGTDPRQWIFGSEGNLGIITSAIVKLFELPEAKHYGSILFPTFESGTAFMYDIAKAGNPPASVRLVDNVQFQFSMALKPASAGMKVLKKKLEKLIVTKLKGFDPNKMVASTLVFEGSQESVAAQEKQVYRLAAKHGGMKAGSENGEKGYQLTFGIAYLRDWIMKHYLLGESFETSVPWSQLISLCNNTKARIFKEHAAMGLPGKPFVTCRVTQVYDTGACVYFYLGISYKGVDNPPRTFNKLENIAREEILKSGGSLSHHHGIGKLRQHFLPEIMSDAAIEWNQLMKDAVDPDNIFGIGNLYNKDSGHLPMPNTAPNSRRTFMNSGSGVLLTGVTGFVGKVVLESLLRRKDELNIKTVYVLIREQTNRRTGEKTKAYDRFKKEVISSACFSELPENWEKDVKVISGDLTAPSFGIEKSALPELQQDLNKIINCAASVEFDLPLADAAAANITSALNVLEFAGNCTKLDAFVNVSTAYVSPHPGEGIAVPEELVNLPFDPEVVYQSILDGTADEKALMAQTGHPNTYTFTKCLSEILLSRRKGDIPLTIVRPSIISSSWKYPHPGWIDSYAAFAGFVSLIGSGMIKCVSAQENTILDIVPCDEVAERVIDTAFWNNENGKPPLIQHVVTGLDRGCRIDTCLYGIESYFQRNPVHRWAKIKKASNGKSIRFDHLRYHTIPSRIAGTWFSLSGKAKQSNQVKKLLNKIEYLNDAFPYFTHNSFAFEAATPLNMPLEAKQYIELVCSGVHENLMKHKPDQTSLAGAKHKHPQQDIRWVNHKPKGNWAIRTASYVVRKGLRKCTDLITFDRPSFENAITSVEPGSLLTIIPNHRSYMDFVLCSYLFFAHPELNIPIPQIAAASEFSKIPFLGWFFQQTYAFYIQRGQGKEDPELKAKIEKLVEQNKTLEFFIEGARSRSRQFLKPKRGLLRALQNTGIPCTILPISISYDLVPEEKAFLSELRAAPKQKMKLSSLLKWTGRMIQGKVKLGRVHIVCGVPVRMDTTTDVHDVSRDVMYELQDKTVVSTFHLSAFLHHHPIKNVDLEWLKQAITERGGTVVDSNLSDPSIVDPLNEKTMRYHWMHHFYSDLLKLQPTHPVLQHHVKENGFVYNITEESPDTEFIPDSRLISLLREVFEPVTKEYMNVLDWASQHNGNLPDAKSLVAKHPESFLPFVEEALEALSGCGLLKEKSGGNGYEPGPRWSEIKSFYSSCHWGEEKALEVKLV